MSVTTNVLKDFSFLQTVNVRNWSTLHPSLCSHHRFWQKKFLRLWHYTVLKTLVTPMIQQSTLHSPEHPSTVPINIHRVHNYRASWARLTATQRTAGGMHSQSAKQGNEQSTHSTVENSWHTRYVDWRNKGTCSCRHPQTGHFHAFTMKRTERWGSNDIAFFIDLQRIAFLSSCC